MSESEKREAEIEYLQNELAKAQHNIKVLSDFIDIRALDSRSDYDVEVFAETMLAMGFRLKTDASPIYTRPQYAAVRRIAREYAKAKQERLSS